MTAPRDAGRLEVAVLGAGIMGRGIAVALARAGHVVRVADPDPGGRAALTRALEAVEPATRDRVSVGGVAADAVAEAGLVIEAVPERPELKAEVWRRLGETAAPDAILASNTSALDIDTLAAHVPDAGRVLGTHWFNPAEIIPVVEVVRGAATRDDVVATTVDLLARAGKDPVVVRNAPGFVANRIQFALVREALLCLEEGLASAEDIDRIVAGSFGVRLAALGPLANADLGGLDTYALILGDLEQRLGERFAPPAVLRDHVAAGRYGAKSGSGLYGDHDGADLARRRDTIVRRVLAAAQEG